MNRKNLSGLMLIMLLVGVLILAFSIQTGMAEQYYYNFRITMIPEISTTLDEINVTVSFEIANINQKVTFSPVSQIGNGFFVDIDIYIPQIVLPTIGYAEHTYSLGKLPAGSYSFTATVTVSGYGSGFAKHSESFTVNRELMPTIQIFPPEIYVDEQTRNFTISVNIRNLEASYNLTSVQLRLEYDVALLSLTGEIVEGDFMKSFAPNGTFFTWFVENHHLVIGILILPPWGRFPEGNGTLVAVSFGISGAINSTIRLTSELGDAVAYVRSTWNRADLNFDGKVNILDLAIFADAFASCPGQFRWNTNVDLDRNQKINIIDAAMIAKNYGKTL